MGNADGRPRTGTGTAVSERRWKSWHLLAAVVLVIATGVVVRMRSTSDPSTSSKPTHAETPTDEQANDQANQESAVDTAGDVAADPNVDNSVEARFRRGEIRFAEPSEEQRREMEERSEARKAKMRETMKQTHTPTPEEIRSVLERR